VKYITAALSQHCGSPVDPVLHLVRFRELFTLLSEGHLDLFVSTVTANTPSPSRAGFAYSNPYFYDGNTGGITQRREIVERVHANLRAQAGNPPPDGLVATDRAFAGLTIAVQKFTAAHLYAEANLLSSRLVLCDSLPAAFEYAEASTEPAIDVILGTEPVLAFMVNRTLKDWRHLTHATGTPLLVTRDQYAVVMAEDSYRLRWFVNSVLFKLDESGKLAEMRRRWLDESYAFPRRAATEGLPFDVEKLVEHYDQGTCRAEPVR
jgi:ABC-type amino acid transport substrate-binding protein